MQKRFSGLKNIHATALWLGGLLAVASLHSNAQSVKLAWNASTNADVAGYKLYYGGTSGDYTNALSVGNMTTATISNLVKGATYYFAATAYNASGIESRFSNEAIYSVPLNSPPTMDQISDITVLENTKNQTVVLTGINLGGSYSKLTKLTIKGVSSNKKIMGNPKIKYKNPNSTGTLTLKPGHNKTGNVVITVTLKNKNKTNNITVLTFLVSIVAQQSAPTVTTQTANTAAVANKPVTFAVNATKSAENALAYQGQNNSADLPSATSATLTLNKVTSDDAGSNSVAVASDDGQTNSHPAALTVYDTPAATLDSAVCSKGAFSFTVNGVPGYKYVIQATTNMVDWVSVQTNTAPFTFVDPDAGQFNQRFYRSVYLP